MEKFSIKSCARGYSDIWEASVGEQLPCEREDRNGTDPFAVASVLAVGHTHRAHTSCH